MIPKKIYYVWFGTKKPNLQAEKNIRNWKNLNPDFEVIKVNENNFNIDKYPFISQAYKSKNWAFASDLARLIIIYQNGGFYFDTDVKMIKPLDNILNNKSVWGMEFPGLINSGLIIGANKGDDDLRNLIKIYEKKDFDSKKLNAMLTPRIVSDYFLEKGLKNNNKVQKLKNGTVIYPTDYFAPLHWWGGGKITNRTIAVHEYNKSWGDKKINRSVILLAKFHYRFPSLYSTLRLFVKKMK